MALQLINRRASTWTAAATTSGQWITSPKFDEHKLKGLYLMVLEGTGTKPPELNIRDTAAGGLGITFAATTTPLVKHIALNENSWIILRGTGEGDGRTTVSFIKLGEVK